MKALRCNTHGEPESLVLENVPTPMPAATQVVVDVHAAAANFPDTLIVQGLYQSRAALPFSPGGECAGVVSAVGSDVQGIAVGDRVIAFPGWGCFAEQVAVEAAQVIAMPPGVDFTTASAFLVTYATSLHALRDRGALQPGETLLVLGASGGVGLAAIELAKALGARVIAAASSAQKLAVCTAHGADAGIDYDHDDLRERLRVLTDGRGPDVVYDPVGGAYSEAALRGIAWRGRLLVVGFAAGTIPRIALNLALLKGASITGVYWGEYAAREPQAAAQDIRQLFAWLAEGRLRPHIAATYPLARGAEALRALMDRKVSGKLVVLPRA